MTATAPRWPTRGEWRTAVVLVLATRAAFWLVAWLAQYLVGGSADRPALGVEHWRRWDADIYATIAEHGYTGPGAEPWSEAFPPAWPLLLRAVSATGIPVTVAALLLTTVATVVAVAYLIRLVDEERPGTGDLEGRPGTGDLEGRPGTGDLERRPGTGDAASAGATPGTRAALFLLVFPTAVFLVAGYSEALFLAGAVPAFREARRGRWARVAVPAGVAVGTRWTGLFLLVGLGVELVAQIRRRPDVAGRPIRRGVPALAVATVPLVAFGAWLAAVRGDPLYFLTAQREGWGRRFVGPVESFRTTWETWSGDYPPALLLTWRLEVVAALVGVALVVVLVRRREWGYAAYAATTLAVLLTSSWYYSVPRALLVLFPAVIVLADVTDRHPRAADAVVAFLAPLATLGVIVFTRGGWFF